MSDCSADVSRRSCGSLTGRYLRPDRSSAVPSFVPVIELVECLADSAFPFAGCSAARRVRTATMRRLGGHSFAAVFVVNVLRSRLPVCLSNTCASDTVGVHVRNHRLPVAHVLGVPLVEALPGASLRTAHGVPDLLLGHAPGRLRGAGALCLVVILRRRRPSVTPSRSACSDSQRSSSAIGTSRILPRRTIRTVGWTCRSRACPGTCRARRRLRSRSSASRGIGPVSGMLGHHRSAPRFVTRFVTRRGDYETPPPRTGTGRDS